MSSCLRKLTSRSVTAVTEVTEHEIMLRTKGDTRHNVLVGFQLSNSKPCSHHPLPNVSGVIMIAQIGGDDATE